MDNWELKKLESIRKRIPEMVIVLAEVKSRFPELKQISSVKLYANGLDFDSLYGVCVVIWKNEENVYFTYLDSDPTPSPEELAARKDRHTYLGGFEGRLEWNKKEKVWEPGLY